MVTGMKGSWMKGVGVGANSCMLVVTIVYAAAVVSSGQSTY